MKNTHKNSNIVFVEAWYKHKHTCEIQNPPESTDIDQVLVEMDIFLQKTDQEFNPEHEEDLLSGMLIW